MKKKRRLNADLKEELFVILSIFCELASITKTEFIEGAILQAAEHLVKTNPELASQSIKELLRKYKATYSNEHMSR